MGLLQKRAYLCVLLSFGLLVSGCGGEEPEAEISLEIIEGPPQITITLHSKLDLDFTLDPDPQLEVSEADTDEFEESGNKFVAEVYAKLKRSAMLRAQSGKQPAFKTDTEYQSLKRYEKMDAGSYAITIESVHKSHP